MDGVQYLPTIAWSFKVRDVILLTSETTENPATFRCTANPFDSSEPGANTADKEVGYVVVDNVGNLYSVIATGINTVDLSDDFRCGVGPQTGKWAVISKTVGDGTAPFLTPIHYRRLDKAAIDNVRRIELDILWKHRLFTYVAFASDDTGTDFTLTNNSALPYMAILVSDVEIPTPVVGDFAGLWRSGSGQVNTDWNASGTVAELLNKPTVIQFTYFT